MAETRATWRQFLFSPKGRFNRGRYWGATVLSYTVIALCLAPLAFVDTVTAGKRISTGAAIYAIIAVVTIIAMSIAHVFTIIKRFHDRDKAWLWIAVGCIPYIGGLWILVECGFLPGTHGRNRFGSDPLNPEDDILTVFDAPALAPLAEPILPTRLGATPQDRMY